jgi:amino acid transporter
MVFHIVFFLVVIIVLWVMAPHQSAKVLFAEFTNEGGWSSIGLSVMVGRITAIYSLLGESMASCLENLLTRLGSDATAYISEEVTDAGRFVPMSIFWSYIINGIMAIILIIKYLFAVDNVENALSDPSGYPFIYVFQNAMPNSGVTALTIIILLIVIAANISWNASTARQTFAIARDNGLPFSKWISHVSATKEIPVNSIILTCTITCLLSLINIGSSRAFNAIISLQVCAIMMTYCVSISCVLYRRIAHPELIPNARWSLGKWGVPVNSLGVCYVSFIFFWSFWPNTIPVDAESFNWSVVLFGGVFIVSLVMYVIQGRKVYSGPVAIIRAARLE